MNLEQDAIQPITEYFSSAVKGLPVSKLPKVLVKMQIPGPNCRYTEGYTWQSVFLSSMPSNFYAYQNFRVFVLLFFYSTSWSFPAVKTSTSLPLNQPLPSTSLGITAQSCLNSLSLPLPQAPGLPALSRLWGHSTPPLNSFHLLLPRISPGLSGLAHSWACGG